MKPVGLKGKIFLNPMKPERRALTELGGKGFTSQAGQQASLGHDSQVPSAGLSHPCLLVPPLPPPMGCPVPSVLDLWGGGVSRTVKNGKPACFVDSLHRLRKRTQCKHGLRPESSFQTVESDALPPLKGTGATGTGIGRGGLSRGRPQIALQARAPLEGQLLQGWR